MGIALEFIFFLPPKIDLVIGTHHDDDDDDDDDDDQQQSNLRLSPISDTPILSRVNTKQNRTFDESIADS